MKKISLFILLSIFGFSSCKKKIVEIPPSNEPVFFVEGTFANDEVNLIVGENAVLSSAIDLSNGIEFYNGTLTSDEYQIKLGVYRGDNEQAYLNVDSLINRDFFELSNFFNQNLVTIQHDFFDNSEKIKEIKWKINNELVGTNSVTLKNPGKINLCALVRFDDNSEAEVCNEMFIGFRRENKFVINSNVNSGLLNASIELSEGQLSSVKWYLDEQEISDALELSHYVNNEKHELKAEILFSNGVIRTRKIIIDGSGQNRGIQDFAVNENKCLKTWDYTVKLDIMKGGELYSTAMVDNNSAQFSIDSFEFYNLNQDNNPVYKVKGNLIANLKSKNSTDIKNVNLNFSWGFILK